MGSSPGKTIPSRGDGGSRELDDFEEQRGPCRLREGSEGGGAAFRAGRAREATPRSPGFTPRTVLMQGSREDWSLGPCRGVVDSACPVFGSAPLSHTSMRVRAQESVRSSGPGVLF